MISEPFIKARPVIENIENHHHQAYYVGGCVRDFLLKRPIGDVDITTSATPNIIQKIFAKVIPVGIEHGTVIVLHDDVPYEVTTFRVEGSYSDQRHPDSVTFINQIDKDLERRDFTINALAMDLSGNIIDLFGGKQDIKKKVIRTVGNGYDRFKEDSLRIIRAIRFASQLGFTIDPQTLNEMKEVSKDISNLAIERITKEFGKMFAGQYLKNGIYYLKESESYMYLPIFKDIPDLIHKIPDSLQPLHSFGEFIAFFHLLNTRVSVIDWVKNWKCSNQVKQEAVAIVKAYSLFEKAGIDNWLVYTLDCQYYEGFTNIMNIFHPELLDENELDKLYNSLPIHSRQELCMNGNDLLSWYPNIKGGPWIQKLLTSIEKEIVFGNLENRKKDIKDWIKWNPPEIN
ncbi:CCA tRNA nucleotidyltransferase [Oceanobacillus sp. Castelsardo]|uniref:CCA tRNA nucleotidyltransferase n=1 Tax=Oceanobacillus sp. Castelsardo TaxID=1851204 RepID=UPI0009ED32F0|nr:CCA tRNA nucleotidyltransferase [Oceanobacillus sp. Castelsardo]